MNCPSVIAWNCRGANSNAFLRYLVEIIRINKLDILVLLETRVSSNIVEGIFKRSYLNKAIISEACNFSGSIWILWNQSDLHIEPLVIHDHIVTVLVRQERQLIWVLSVVYALPNTFLRKIYGATSIIWVVV